MPRSRSSRLSGRSHGAEFDLIRFFQRITKIPSSLRSSIIAGIGDDAAIIRPRAGHVLLATTDILTERVHFDLSYMTYRQIGYRAAVANLSDMAAMGASPRYALVAIAVAPHTTVADARALFTGISEACDAADTVVIGGDTSASRQDLFLSITVLGEARPGQILRRSGARPGNLLYVTGTLGDARAGLALLRRRKAHDILRRSRLSRYLISRHVAPTARLAEGEVLAKRRLASAAIDLSDGLAGDLRHMCEASSVGALLDIRRLPLSSALRGLTGRRTNPFTHALIGGEDYELLFTVSPGKAAHVDALIRAGRLCATPIGVITPPRQGVRIITVQGDIQPLTASSYEHRLGGRYRR